MSDSDRPAPSSPTCGYLAVPLPPHVIYSSWGCYIDAVVVSVEPFVLRSQNGDMTWHHEQPENFRFHRPEPVAPPGLPPYWDRPKGSAFGPPLECPRCGGSGLEPEARIMPTTLRGPRGGLIDIRLPRNRCHQCHGDRYANAVRMEE